MTAKIFYDYVLEIVSKTLWLCLVVLLSGCGLFGRHDESLPDESDLVTQVWLKFQGKKAELQALADPETGWPDPLDCDGLLWAGLARASGVETVRLDLAELESGVIGRRPATRPVCWSLENGDQGAKSSTSRDMATGYVFGLWRIGDLEAVKRFAAYGEAHSVSILGLRSWIIGQPYPEQAERVLLSPNGVGQVGRIIHALSDGADDRSYRQYGSLYEASGEDYQRHLTVLGILLNGEVDRGVGLLLRHPPGGWLTGIDEGSFGVLKRLADESPEDALFQAGLSRYDNDYQRTIEMLLGENECPSYARSSEVNCLVHWLFAARLVLGNTTKE